MSQGLQNLLVFGGILLGLFVVMALFEGGLFYLGELIAGKRKKQDFPPFFFNTRGTLLLVLLWNLPFLAVFVWFGIVIYQSEFLSGPPRWFFLAMAFVSGINMTTFSLLLYWSPAVRKWASRRPAKPKELKQFIALSVLILALIGVVVTLELSR